MPQTFVHVIPYINECYSYKEKRNRCIDGWNVELYK